MRPLEWEIPDVLAASARPGRELDAAVPRESVDRWLGEVQAMGIRSIICLLDKKHLVLYDELPGGLVEYYRQRGFQAYNLAVRDPAHYPGGWEELEANLERIWDAYQGMMKPVLVHCSAGIDRTGRVVGYLTRRLGECND
ncbi:MAG: hypothetical protein HPY50_21875 [Firmicutes bacterium]|nr:hypothetical protein [Bacillota bacterium]